MLLKIETLILSLLILAGLFSISVIATPTALTTGDYQLTAAMTCASPDQHSNYDMPVFVFDAAGGEAAIELAEQGSSSWKYTVTVTPDFN